jgi:hypothetical protein
MQPLVATFVRLTIIVTIGLVALALFWWVFHWIIVAAVIAGVIIGGLFLYNLIRRRSGAPAIRM